MVVLMKALTILMMFSLISCSQNGSEENISISQSNNKFGSEIKTLLKENEVIQYEMAEDNIFQSASANQVNLFRQFILRSRRFLVLLLDDYTNNTALKSLEKAVLKVEGLPIAVRDQSYIYPYIAQIKELVEVIKKDISNEPEPERVYFFFNETTNETLTRIFSEEAAANFLPRTNDHGPYLGVDSFKEKNNGTVSLISPTITIENIDYTVSFYYLVRFYKVSARAERLIRFYIGEDKEDINAIEWRDLNIEIGPDAASFGEPPVYTDAVDIEQTNTNIRVKIEYTSSAEKGYFPAFNLFNVKLEEKL